MRAQPTVRLDAALGPSMKLSPLTEHMFVYGAAELKAEEDGGQY